MRRVIKFKTFFSPRNTKGYTIVELLVVMGIIAILLPLTFGGYNGIRKQKYVQHVANTAQTEIRGTFIDVLATKVESVSGTVCDNRSPKIKAVMIRMMHDDNANINPVAKFAMCEDSSGLAQPVKIEDIDPAKEINYKQSIEVTCSGGSSGTCGDMGYFFLIFTSPYGKYYSYYVTTSGNNEGLAIDKLYTLGGSGVGWEKGGDQIYVPKIGRDNVAQSSNATIWFDSNPSGLTDGIRHKITISKNGSVKLD